MQAVAAKLTDAARTGRPADAPLGPLFKTAGMTLVSTVGGAAGPLYGTLLPRDGQGGRRPRRR